MAAAAWATSSDAACIANLSICFCGRPCDFSCFTKSAGRQDCLTWADDFVYRRVDRSAFGPLGDGFVKGVINGVLNHLTDGGDFVVTEQAVEQRLTAAADGADPGFCRGGDEDVAEGVGRDRFLRVRFAV